VEGSIHVQVIVCSLRFAFLPVLSVPLFPQSVLFFAVSGTPECASVLLCVRAVSGTPEYALCSLRFAFPPVRSSQSCPCLRARSLCTQRLRARGRRTRTTGGQLRPVLIFSSAFETRYSESRTRGGGRGRHAPAGRGRSPAGSGAEPRHVLRRTQVGKR